MLIHMGQKTLISSADKELTSLILESSKTAVAEEKAGLNADDILFGLPKTKANNKKVTVFLYNVTEQEPEGPVSMHYLITPLMENDKDAHRLIDKIISSLPLTTATSREDEVLLKIEIESLSFDELTKLWNMLDAPFKLSLAVKIGQVGSQNEARNSKENAGAAKASKVTLLYQTVFRTFTEQSNGWKTRNMMIRQWIMQDFKKTTDMTVDEMDVTLDKLGIRLEQQQPTDQFAEPLNRLAKYYQHQLDELKGAQKVSSKQTGNIQTISAWVKEIKELIEALGS